VNGHAEANGHEDPTSEKKKKKKKKKSEAE